MKRFTTWLYQLGKDIFHTIYPDLCVACLRLPKANDASFCPQCLYEMPYTDHFLIRENDVTKHFMGRISLYHGAALLRFREGGIVQNMLHGLKYRKRREVGEILGEIAAVKMMDSKLFAIPDIILPVPIHPKKILKRSYNQSSVFGKAISSKSGIPFTDLIMIKTKETPSQTGKSRTERVENVQNVFELVRPQEINGRHVLLVDDVVTTGATLEACCELLKNGGTSHISILCIAAAL